jgi:hypothetical protein
LLLLHRDATVTILPLREPSILPRIAAAPTCSSPPWAAGIRDARLREARATVIDVASTCSPTRLTSTTSSARTARSAGIRAKGERPHRDVHPEVEEVAGAPHAACRAASAL